MTRMPVVLDSVGAWSLSLLGASRLGDNIWTHLLIETNSAAQVWTELPGPKFCFPTWADFLTKRQLPNIKWSLKTYLMGLYGEVSTR